ncbi:helix-turn-helix domain-containing protein [uncultured Agathobaculum sp.]|uniref:helix-turn-helix domain-containing protein n=1 Tax=Flavonifractor sp. An9 TaxID=1965664 RepID=UPI000B39FCDC|nr:helix-turn-helix transcriptional regulator [Flavonifractor sp. An9]OUN11859.1 XRE family transcriptional regulator [Flavonifractor sp. An9]
MISYDRLWLTMKERGVTQYSLIKNFGISPAQITRLKRNESVSTHTIEVFCRILDCNVEDIMQYVKENEQE